MVMELFATLVGLGACGFGFTHLLAYMNRVEAEHVAQEEAAS